MGFRTPPVTRNAGGEQRRFGFELEFAGVEIDVAAITVVHQFGGNHVIQNPFVHRVRGSRVGDFAVEIDAAVLKDRTYRRHLQELGVDLGSTALGNSLDELIRRVAGTIVPCEIVSPPMQLHQVPQIDALRERLRRRRARGTADSLLYAFGLHINTEAPELSADSVLRHLRAFLLLYDELVQDSQIDFTRRITPYIDPFPAVYRRRVLDSEYQPAMAELIDDYIGHNPSRDRPLDLLPLFAWVDGQRVYHQVERADLVGARPAYHYRLPNCLIGQPEWRVATEWNRWIRVEELAADKARLSRLMRSSR